MTAAHTEMTARAAGPLARRGPMLALLAWGAAFLLLVLLAACAWQGPDIFYHLFLGQRVLETGAFQPTDSLLGQQPHYVNIYWLFQIVCQGLFAAGGIYAVSLLFLAAWVATFWLWVRTARLAATPALGLPLMLIAILISQGRFEPRPEVPSYLLLSLQIWWLSTWDFRAPLGWRRYAAFALSEALWANIHGYFVFGPFLVAARLAGALAQREGKPAAAAAAKLFALTCAASILSPFGPRTWTFAVTLASFLRDMRGAVMEFGPPTGVFLTLWTVKLFWAFWGLCLLMGALLAVRRRGRVFSYLLAAAGLGLSATSARNLPLLPLLLAPAFRDFADFLAAPARSRPRGRPAESAAAPARFARAASAPAVVAGFGLVALALSVWTVTGGFHRSVRSETRFGIALPYHTYPLRFAEALRRVDFRGKLFNNAADGGYLEYFFPQVRPYMDSRYVDTQVVREYFAGLSDPQAFRQLDLRHRFDGVLLKVVDSPRLVLALLSSGEWVLAHADLHRAFFLRGSPADAALAAWRQASRRFYQGDDLGERVNGLPAIQWVGILASQPDRALLLEALQQFAEAPRIPSFVILYALQYAQQRGDREIAELARRMRARMLALDSASAQGVDQLLRMPF